MSETIKTGWLEDCNGEKFAPKTLTSQITTNDGVALEQKIETDILNATDETKTYTDTKIANLINGAPSTLDTLKEIADAMAENESVVDALDDAIGTKANQAELDTHTGNSTIHITASERTNWDAAKTNLDSHLGNTTVHITANERTAWNDANSKKHEHSNKAILDATTESFTTEHKNKIVNLEENATQLGNQMEVLLTSSTQLRNDVDGLNNKINNEISQTTDRTLYGSKEGGIKLIGVKGASEQAVYSGKNLLDTNSLSETTSNGVTFTPVYNNGLLEYVSASGTSTDIADYHLPNFSYESKTVLTGCPSGGSEKTYSVRATSIGGDKGNGLTISANTSTHVYIRIESGVTVNDLRFYPMIRLTSIEDSTYEPFVGNASSPSPSYPQPIESVGDSGGLVIKQEGKNLLDLADKTTKYPTYVYELVAVDIPIGIYTFSCEHNIPSNLGWWVSLYDENKVFVGGSGQLTGGTNKSIIQTTARAKYISMYVNSAVTMTDIQLELGTEFTGFESYHSNTITIPLSEPLRGIGDIKDEIVCKDGVWGVNRKIRSRVFDGSENWQASSTNASGIHRRRYEGWTTSAPKGSTANTAIANVLCDSYIPNSANATYSRIQGVSIDTVGALDIYDENYNTNNLSSWKAWLSENPITVEYELATLVFEPFTDQTPFYQMQSYDTVTYISTDSKVEPSIEVKFGTSEVGATTLLNYNGVKLNEIAIESGDLTFETEDIDFSSEF